jgi:hypothetical protein
MSPAMRQNEIVVDVDGAAYSHAWKRRTVLGELTPRFENFDLPG